MNQFKVLGAAVFAISILAIEVAAPLGCSSSSNSGSPDSGACTSVDATLMGSLSSSGGSCSACIQAQCASEVTACSGDCMCNDTSLAALACIAGLAGNASLAAESSCVAPLANSSDTKLGGLGHCLLTQCQAQCGGGATDAGPCDAVGSKLAALLEAGTGTCESCLQTSCFGAASACSANCECNASAVTALDCLANLGDATSIASASTCVGPLTSAAGNTALATVGSCLLTTCATACGAAPEGGAGFQGAIGVAVGVGYNSACAITAGGALICWGENDFGQVGVPIGNCGNPCSGSGQVTGLTSGVTSVSVGEFTACAVVGGSVECWGSNGAEELGSTSGPASSAPAPIPGLTTGVTSVSVGPENACAVTAGGGVMCWGTNGSGGLGNNSTTDSPTPVQVVGLTSGVTAVSTGASEGTACAITAGGGVACWGGNSPYQYGLLGNGSTAQNSPIPVQVSGLTSGVTSVSVGYDSACAVTSAGTVMCWGHNSNGELGMSEAAFSTMQLSAVPVQVTGFTSNVTSVSVGNEFACALTTVGGVMCWGENSVGELGNNSTVQYSAAPVQVTGLTSGVTSVSAGGNYACAATGCGIVCWGEQANFLGSSKVPMPVGVGNSCTH